MMAMLVETTIAKNSFGNLTLLLWKVEVNFSDLVYYRWPRPISADYRPIVGRLSVDSRSIVGR